MGSPQDNILQSARHYLGAFGAVYERPQRSDIFRSIHISITDPSAGQVQAVKLFTLSIADPFAAMAGFRGVARIYKPHGYAKLHAFVGEELAKLIERPTGHLD